jgi:hypothetical protein
VHIRCHSSPLVQHRHRNTSQQNPLAIFKKRKGNLGFPRPLQTNGKPARMR